MAASEHLPLLSRRRFLRGVGLGLALPAFEALLPRSLQAAAAPLPGTTPSGAPLRLAYLYIPNGVVESSWVPSGEGTQYQLNETMRPLEEFRSQFQILSGLEHQHGLAGKDGGGDHARATASVLTGARPKKTAGSDIRVGISVDQVAAQAVASQTRFASLELSCDATRKSGSCDSGYSCAYQFNLSWRSETQPLSPESNPRLVYERLFGLHAPGGTPSLSREQRQRSLLDFVREDARQLQNQLGRNDQQKLDEYLTGVREIERRIEHFEKFGPLPKVDSPAPEGTPTDYAQHLRLMMDLQVLAFQTDSTRVCSFLLAHDGSNRSFQTIGVSEGHHDLSHHQNNADKIAKLRKIDLFYAEAFAYFLRKMHDTRDPSGKSLLDHSMVVYCGGLSDGNRHGHDNLPVLLAGGGGGLLHPGQHLRLPPTPMSNMHLQLLRHMGVPAERFGDSTAPLASI
jgi:hypothetical protein